MRGLRPELRCVVGLDGGACGMFCSPRRDLAIRVAHARQSHPAEPHETQGTTTQQQHGTTPAGPAPRRLLRPATHTPAQERNKPLRAPRPLVLMICTCVNSASRRPPRPGSCYRSNEMPCCFCRVRRGVTVHGTLRPPELRSVVGLVEGLVECLALLGEI